MRHPDESGQHDAMTTTRGLPLLLLAVTTYAAPSGRDAYARVGAAAARKFRDAVLRKASSTDVAGGNRTLLLSFPNTGTTMTMSIAQSLSVWMDVGWNESGQPEKGRKRFRLGHEMCSEYCGERQVSKKEGEFDCGRGAYFANAMRHDPVYPVLVKSHGVAFAFAQVVDRGHGLEGGAFGSSALVEHLDGVFGPCGDDEGLSRVLQLYRNPFDTLVARYRFECAVHHRSGCGPRDFRAAARSDLCVLLRWHHRAAAYACPTVHLDYDAIYSDTEAWVRTVLASLGALGAAPEDVAKLARHALRYNVEARNATPGLPFHVVDRPDLYDAETVAAVARVVETYLARSADFRSPALLDCRDFGA